MKFLLIIPTGSTGKYIFYLTGSQLITFLVSWFFIITPTIVQAQWNNGDQEKYRPIKISDVRQGSLLVKTKQQDEYYLSPTVGTDATFNVSGLIVRAKVRQTFTNPSDDWIEAVYVFPLPENAAVDHMQMRIGERIIVGEIKEKAEAKKIYQVARQQGKKASLIEQERPNLFTNSIANIGPGETIVVEIEYQQTIQYEQVKGEGVFQFRFPTTFTPRYIPGSPEIRTTHSEDIPSINGSGWALNTSSVPDASRITPPFRDYADWGNPVSITIHLNPGFPVNDIISPYHKIQSTHATDGTILVELADHKVFANRDFNLKWTIDTGHAPKAALFNEIVDGDYYHLLMIMPPTDGLGNAELLAREVIYILDTSGSMAGESIKQAKAGLSMALQRLRPIDTFNIIEFDNRHTVLFSEPQEASKVNVRRAIKFVDQLVADGGTEMYPALNEALTGSGQENVVSQVIFLTDGSVGNEMQLFKLIQNKLGNRRLYMVGIGSAPNSFFMSRAAEFGRGTYTYIGSISEVSEKMNLLFSRIETPVLTDLTIDWPVDADIEIWPRRLPDLYVGEPLLVSAKTESFAGPLKVRAQRANLDWQASIPLQGGQQSSGVAALWARHKIKALTDSIVEGANKSEVRPNIVSVALQHHLVSKYTSLVAVDKTPSRTAEQLKQRNIANNLPKGSHFGRYVNTFARTSAGIQFKLLTGIFLILVSILILNFTSTRQRNYWRLN